MRRSNDSSASSTASDSWRLHHYACLSKCTASLKSVARVDSDCLICLRKWSAAASSLAPSISLSCSQPMSRASCSSGRPDASMR